MKNKKHDELVSNYVKTKRKHLERLASKMLENEEKISTFKKYKIDKKFLDKL